MGRKDARRRYRGPLRAAVFDWAGTVVDFGSRAPVIAIMRTFHDFGVPISTDEARGPMGMAKRDHLREVLALPRVAEQWRQKQRCEPDEASIDRLYHAFLAAQLQVLVEHSAIIPGCLASMRHCRQRGLRLGSSTGYTAELMRLLAPAAREQGLDFEAVVCTDDVPEGRPAPWMCLENARRLGVYPVDAIVVVDDTTVGIEAGANAGMWTIGVAKSGNLVGLSVDEFEALPAADQRSRVAAAHQRLQLAGADVTIDSVADLPAALEQIEQAMRLE
jgi:phosphonoacetaldehyde hydrolase